jgi:hypothetical protein
MDNEESKNALGYCLRFYARSDTISEAIPPIGTRGDDTVAQMGKQNAATIERPDYYSESNTESQELALLAMEIEAADEIAAGTLASLNGLVGIALKVTRRANLAFKVAAKAANDGKGYPVGHYLLTVLYPVIGEALPVLATRGRKSKTAEEKLAEKEAAEKALAVMQADVARLEELRALAATMVQAQSEGKVIDVAALLASLTAS